MGPRSLLVSPWSDERRPGRTVVVVVVVVVVVEGEFRSKDDIAKTHNMLDREPLFTFAS